MTESAFNDIDAGGRKFHKYNSRLVFGDGCFYFVERIQNCFKIQHSLVFLGKVLRP